MTTGTDQPQQLTLPLWDPIWRPRWPLATDDLVAGVYRMARRDALERRYVEANPQAISNLLVVDIDRPDAALRALSAQGSHPMPNAVVENPRNGHAHAVWALAAPIPRTEYARRKPLAYAAAITEGLRRAVDGDAAYSGLLTKNPLHASWRAEWIHTEPRSLDELAELLGDRMPPTRWRYTKTHRESPAGLGRNCALFESARTWAYREIRHHLPTRDVEGLERAIHSEVHARNTAFPVPLPQTEARAIAASIHRWIVTRSRMWADGAVVYEATFTAIQSARGKKGGQRSADVRRAAAREKQQAMLADLGMG